MGKSVFGRLRVDFRSVSVVISMGRSRLTRRENPRQLNALGAAVPPSGLQSVGREGGRARSLGRHVRMKRFRRLLLLSLFVLPLVSCTKGNECDQCQEDADCKEGFLCTSFS